MKWFVFTLAAILVMTNGSYGVVTLGYVENPDPGVGYKSYTVQALGPGVNVLGGFRITGDIHQVWTAPGTQSEWINNSNGNTPGDPMDSYVIFGDERLPDLFSPHFSSTTAGSGLGLALVQGVVVRCHGSVSAINAPRGLKVRLEFPTSSSLRVQPQ